MERKHSDKDRDEVKKEEVNPTPAPTTESNLTPEPTIPEPPAEKSPEVVLVDTLGEMVQSEPQNYLWYREMASKAMAAYQKFSGGK